MTAPAGWYADPLSRFEHRYWDGSQWTEHVASGGEASTDRLDAATAPATGVVTDDTPAAATQARQETPPSGTSTLPSAAGAPAEPRNAWAPPAATASAPRANGLAVGSLAVGVASLFGAVIVIGGIGGIAAIVMGGIARKRMRESGGRESGDGMAIAGIVCGAAAVLLSILVALFLVTALVSMPFFMDGMMDGPSFEP